MQTKSIHFGKKDYFSGNFVQNSAIKKRGKGYLSAFFLFIIYYLKTENAVLKIIPISRQNPNFSNALRLYSIFLGKTSST